MGRNNISGNYAEKWPTPMKDIRPHVPKALWTPIKINPQVGPSLYNYWKSKINRTSKKHKQLDWELTFNRYNGNNKTVNRIAATKNSKLKENVCFKSKS